ncbi:MAG: HAD hydrolase family protein [Brevinema sp.]
MKKLLACDIDGTILHRLPEGRATDYLVAQEDLDAIQEFRKQGNFFTFCTGRTLLGVKAVLDEFPIEADAAIVSGGARLHRFLQHSPLTTEKLADFFIPAELATDIITHFYKQGDSVLYWSNGHDDFAFGDRTTDWMKENSPTFVTLEEWLANPSDISSIGLTPLSNPHEWIKQAEKDINSRWDNKLDCHSNLLTLDVSHGGVSKGSGLSHMRQLLGNEHQCYAVGDALNDVPMFKEVGQHNAYLRAGGDERALPHVKKTVSSVAECIYDILEG